MKYCLLFVLLLGGGAFVHAQESVAVHILERDAERIKATGDLRGNAKLMQALLQFRDQDVFIAGNDFRYGFIFVIPYEQIVSVTYSDVGGHLPKSMRESMPLFNPDYAGQDQRWLRVVYAVDGNTTDLFLMLSKETDGAVVNGLATHLDKPVLRFVDGVPVHQTDAVFRHCRIFQTLVQKEKSKTDDFECLVVMTDSAFVLAGQDDHFQNQYTIAYPHMKTLYYEHSKQTSYVGRMPGLGAFRKPRHWFVIDYADAQGVDMTAALLLEAEVVVDFRDVAEAKSGLGIKSYAVLPVPSPPPQISLPAPIDLPREAPSAVAPKLESVQTIRCTLGPGYRVHWDKQTLNKEGETRFNDVTPELVFEQIDWVAHTAQMRQGEGVVPVRLAQSGSGVTFISVGAETTVTTIFSQNNRLLCVHSIHESGTAPVASQFYGIAEVEE